jgi:thiol-disulfide isomerase/thioredoxin
MSYAKFKDLGSNSMFESSTAQSMENYTDEVAKPIVKIRKIVSEDDKMQLLQNYKIVVNDVYGKWCPPCKSAKPGYKTIANRYKNIVMFTRENEQDKISKDVAGVPTFQFYVNGKPQGVITGADLKSVEQKIKSLVGIL